ncbi:tetratricopeptide repeat protein [Bacillus sp. FJAT-44742]|uniref:tetratricopeptide repeat protein n=1 Tax=Bacillus sp. FJAT-44742 TaxID=2014005 RepID=UPI000C24514C|nr:tetratricopeptide repeat protein [Bacillus sp. FJAT-44742]
MGQENEKGKVIQFPGAANTLVERGLDHLKKGNPKEGVAMFQEALAHDPDNEQASYGLLLAYADAGDLKEGKRLAETMLQEAKGEYFEVLQVYISILAQLGEYKKVVSTLEAVQSETRFPAHLAEPFFEMMALSKSMIEADEQSRTLVEDEEELQMSREAAGTALNLLTSGSFEQQWQALSLLKGEKSSIELRDFEQVMKSEKAFPVIKSFILLLLKDRGISQEVTIVKKEMGITVVPEELPSFEEIEPVPSIFSLLDEHLGQSDPSLFNTAHHLLKQISLHYYPFSLEPKEAGAWAAAIHHEAATHFGQEPDVQELARLYETDETCCQKLKDELQQLNTEEFLT